MAMHVSSKWRRGVYGSALASKVEVTLEAMEKDSTQGMIVVRNIN